jgi:hypothetical protein
MTLSPLVEREKPRIGTDRFLTIVRSSRLRPSNIETVTKLYARTQLIIGTIVAVGTTIADRPPHRAVRARLRIRLLQMMSFVEVCVGYAEVIHQTTVCRPGGIGGSGSSRVEFSSCRFYVFPVLRNPVHQALHWA